MKKPLARDQEPVDPTHLEPADSKSSTPSRELPSPWGDRSLIEPLLDVVDVTVLVLDGAGRIKFINEHGARMLGAPAGELTGRNWIEEFLPEDCRQEGRQMLDDLIAGRGPGPGRVEGRVVTVGGEERILVWRHKVLRDQGGQLLATVSSGTDVTARRREEAEWHQALRLDAVGRLAGGIAHDFNNILAAILGYAEIAADEVSDQGDLGDCVRGIIRASERARELVRQILSFSRQGLPRDEGPVRLDQVIEDAEKLLRASLPSTIRIRTAIHSSNPVVIGDPTRIEQVLVNLGANAADAMQDSGGVLEIVLDEAPDGASLDDADLRISVRDTGRGMTEGVRAKAFEPFFTTKPIGQGSGLGLSAVHGIVTQMGGRVRAHSRVGEGTRIEIRLPRFKESAPPEKATPPPPAGGARRSARILLVDDEASLGQLGKRLLERIGHRVTAFSSGAEALEHFRRHSTDFDLLVTDLTMPAMTGDVLARETLAIRPGFPTILCTGNAARLSRSRTGGAGVRRVVMKPFTLGEIDSCIREVLAEQAIGLGPHRSSPEAPVEAVPKSSPVKGD